MTHLPVERPAAIERPGLKRRAMVSARLLARRARRKPRLILLSAAVVLAGSISAFAVIEAVQAPDATELAAATAAPAAEKAAVGPVTGAATVLGKDEARLDPAEVAEESAPEAELAAVSEEAELARDVTDLATGSIRRPADPAIAAVARMMADGGEPVRKVDLAQVRVAESEAEVLAIETALLEQGSSDAFEVSGDTLPAQEEEETASIPVPQPRPDYTPEQEQAALSEEPEPAADEQETSAIPAGFGEAKVTASVNFRSAPSNQSKVIRVLPTNAVVQAETSCEHFCEVTHEGTKGYIYKTYLKR